MKIDYKDLVSYMGMRSLPKGFVQAYDLYEPDDSTTLMDRNYYENLLAPYDIPEDKKRFLDETLDAIEKDERVLAFSKFFVWDICSMRNKYDVDNYTELLPSCLGKYNEAYAFIILLACIPVSELEMIRRGVPRKHYEDIPHRMIRDQINRYLETGKIDILDMPWKLNFYTISIFLHDRFLFIPCEFTDKFTLYRSNKTGKVVGIYDGGCLIDSEGQLILEGEDAPVDDEEHPADQGDGYEYGRRKALKPDTFRTYIKEDESSITGFYMNPAGFTENRVVTLDKSEYKPVLRQGDYLIGFHIPSGEGYTPERMRNSMKLADQFFKAYYPELKLDGFWSESWLYDKRLELIIGGNTNIANVHKQMFCYSGGWDGEMAYVHLFRSMDNKMDECECTTRLQKGAREFLRAGNRFISTGMIFLNEELYQDTVYLTEEDEQAFNRMLNDNGIVGPEM